MQCWAQVAPQVARAEQIRLAVANESLHHGDREFATLRSINSHDFADRSDSKSFRTSGVSELACSLFLQSYRSAERQTSSLFCGLCRGEKCHLCTKLRLCVKMVLQQCRERAGVEAWMILDGSKKAQVPRDSSRLRAKVWI